ncbi:MAG: hypothetical protein U0930_02330 [Pirellulales bacterium]
MKKEKFVAAHDFEQAALCLKQQEHIEGSIRELVRDQKLTITPELIESILRSLGYNGA